MPHNHKLVDISLKSFFQNTVWHAIYMQPTSSTAERSVKMSSVPQSHLEWNIGPFQFSNQPHIFPDVDIKILNWSRFLELSNWNLNPDQEFWNVTVSVTLHISAASNFKHTYLTKMFNERVTDSISCDQKTFLRRTAFRWSLNKYCFKMLFTVVRDRPVESRACRCCNWFVVERTEQVSLKSIALVL